MARSVVLFDEAQTLPLALALPTLATLSRLAERDGPYGSTVVFATATQPAFDAFDQRIAPDFAAGGWQPTEIASNMQSLYADAANRVHIQWRHDATTSLNDIAAELQTHEQVLCIVNLKRHAADLIASLRERGIDEQHGLLHLSTNMCPAHREEVLQEVGTKLKQGLPIRLIATQCVEAGVDLDFPIVYRAMAPLDAIAQAAGRCNRHGRGPQGQVIVFKPQDDRKPYPPGYGEAVDATESFLNCLSTQANLDTTEILGNPKQLRNYYRRFYCLTGKDTTESDGERPLLDAIRSGDFRDVASRYRLIQQDSIRVLAPYKSDVFKQLRDEIEGVEHFTLDFIRDWIRRASPHAVNLFRPKDNEPITSYLQPVQFSHRRTVETWEADWFYTLPDVKYDPLLGISTEVEKLWIA
jgi:CRISPR/Cas system-associated endonuclease/helicase Cas3